MNDSLLGRLVPTDGEFIAGTLDRCRLRADICQVARFIESRGGGNWLLYDPDPLRFTMYLYGITLGGGNVTLLPDIRRGTLTALAGTYCGQVGTDALVENHVSFPIIFNNEGDSEELPGIPPGDVTVLTSGSSGRRKRFTRTLASLLAEAGVLQRMWPGSEGLLSASMVSHHHMYGLMFAVVWPASCGVQVVATHLAPVPDFSTLDNPKRRSVRLISSPAYLHRVESSFGLANFEDMHQRKVRLDCVFSAGSALDPGKAVLASVLLDCPINEIYGSSETGAVATRRIGTQTHWHALPGVDLRIEGQKLIIDSAYIANELPRPYLSADAVEREANGFKLVGRTDRIVKVEGRRVSLQQIEDAVQRVGWVEDSAAVLIDDGRSSIALAVVLDNEGLSSLHWDGKPKLDRRLRRALAEDLEAVMVPRRIRYVTTLPLNTQGKLDNERLFAVFEKGARLRPSVLGVSSSENQVELELTLDPDLIAFAGHFPEKAILPGVALVHWVMLFGEQYLRVTPTVGQLGNIKFMRILVPNNHLHLTLVHGAGYIQYHCRCAGVLCSKGKINLNV